MIEFDHFSWSFGDVAAPALQDITLRIGPGEFVVLTGPSGAGKTTLALAACGLLIGRRGGQAAGRVLVAGEDVWTTPLRQLARRTGIVQQNPELNVATTSVLEEIAFGLEKSGAPAGPAARDAALAPLDLAHLRDAQTAALSAGDLHRVGVAALLAARPPVIILDEPSVGFAPAALARLYERLADECRRQGQTVVIIAPQVDALAALRPRIVRLERGRLTHDLPAGTAPDDYPAWLSGPEAVTLGARHVPSAVPTGPVLIDVVDVTIELNDRTVLADVSFQVCPGELVAVCGPGGAGKSVLLHALSGLIPRTHGQMRICNIAVTPAAVPQLARRIGLVFQNADHQLVAESVWAEALFAAHNLQLFETQREERAERLLEQAGLGPRKDDAPAHLSWGEKRRLNLIATLLHDPQVLLLDQPLTGQDWDRAEWMLDLVRGVVAEPPEYPAAALIVTHDLRAIARACTRALCLDAGRLVLDTPLPAGLPALQQLLERPHP